MPSLSAVAVGPQKTATTWLYVGLSDTDAIAMPTKVKETFFWDRDFARGEPWYFSHFEDVTAARLIEVGPSYFHSAEACERLQAHNPNLKIIVTLRDPAERAFSLYLHHRRKGRVGEEFWSAADKLPEILATSRYGTHVPMWIDAFGAENVLVLLQSDIEQAPAHALEAVARFLDVPITYRSDHLFERVNTGGLPKSPALARLATRASAILRHMGLYSVINTAKALKLKSLVYGGGQQELPKLFVQDRRKLIAMFAADIVFVEQLMNRSLSEWRDDRGR